jgi:P-type Ca2+ transporter type 2C
MTHHASKHKGLCDREVEESRARFGFNKSIEKRKNNALTAVLSLAKEPMFILLLVASAIYFVMGKWDDGIFMVSAIVLVAAISLYQDSRSRMALDALRKLSQPFSKVIRNSEEIEIASEDIVVGDYMIVEEGTSIPADGEIIQSNDFQVNESILTGESFAISKDENDKLVFQGTHVVAGLAICKVVAIGNQTRLGAIGKSMEQIEEQDSPLQIQINNFVKMMAFAGLFIFILVWVLNYLQSGEWMESLLKSLTLAMSILPEEIPVAFTTFMALGAWRLMKLGIIVKQTKTVETLGSATVICVDKTGTITENKMTLVKIYCFATGNISDPSATLDAPERELISMAMWSSEPVPFDPMERALHDTYEKLIQQDDRPFYKLIHEYPLGGRPPMMTHIFENEKGIRIIAAKGAPEALIQISLLSEEEKARIVEVVSSFSKLGYRVLAIGNAIFEGTNFHLRQEQFQFHFLGLVAFYDPPKANIQDVFKSFYAAGIKVKILTGDNELTTSTIAKQIGLKEVQQAIGGEELMAMSEKELEQRVTQTTIFSRMFPEAKLRIINALKAQGEVVAMTGDGVNDGPALRAAHIGIAMGNKGSEIARQASSLILVKDDLARMVDAIAMGRKIYTNLKKAIQYIISIHIPIIFTVFVPLLLGWKYPSIFSPIHVIFLELIMGPTCSIIYENEPIEKNLMLQKPRPFTTTFFNIRELITSIIQGLVITLFALLVYQYAVQNEMSEQVVRTMVFLVLISANIFLTLVNRSFYYSVITTLAYKNKLVPLIILITVVMVGLMMWIQPVNRFFEFDVLNSMQISIALGAGFVSVIWFEIVKGIRRNKKVSL